MKTIEKLENIKMLSRQPCATRRVLTPSPHHESASCLSSLTREYSFCAMSLDGDGT